MKTNTLVAGFGFRNLERPAFETLVAYLILVFSNTSEAGVNFIEKGPILDMRRVNFTKHFYGSCALLHPFNSLGLRTLDNFTQSGRVAQSFCFGRCQHPGLDLHLGVNTCLKQKDGLLTVSNSSHSMYFL